MDVSSSESYTPPGKKKYSVILIPLSSVKFLIRIAGKKLSDGIN